MQNHKDRQATSEELEAICRDFRSMLDEPSVGENQIQGFLEEHSELIPTPFLLNHNLHLEFVISKLRLSTKLTTDFAYYTKSSSTWWCCLVELEDSEKKIFTNDQERVVFHSDFNKALGQVESWRSFLIDHAKELNDRLVYLRQPMALNRVKFKYVLIYGRRAEMERNQERVNRWEQLNRDDFRVMTYDSLISSTQYLHVIRKNILSEHLDGFEVKRLNQPDTFMFATFYPHQIFLPNEMQQTLEAHGYCIESWRKGHLLTSNGRYSEIDHEARNKYFSSVVKKEPNKTK